MSHLAPSTTSAASTSVPLSSLSASASPPSLTFHFAGRVALVTGASAGIGAATALAFARAGAHVVMADCTTQAGEAQVQVVQRAAEERARAAGGSAARVLFVPCDVSNPQLVAALFATIEREFGRLDFAFNNAGVEGEKLVTGECTEANWDRVIAINLTGVWLCMKAELALMMKAKPGEAEGTTSSRSPRAASGSIVNNSSVAGLVGFSSIPAYSASKHGLVGLTKTAALEYAKSHVRVNAVCPGFIHTAMVDRFAGGDPAVLASFAALEPVGRMGTPDEVAVAVLFLCADDAAFITGLAMPVDGGYVAQ